MFGLGVQELLLILVLVLIFFGAEKIPQLARSLGKGMSEFRKAQQDVKDELMSDRSETSSTGDLVNETVSPTSPCSSCQHPLPKGSRFCPQCGQTVETPLSCTICQRPLNEDDKFCPNCGQARS